MTKILMLIAMVTLFVGGCTFTTTRQKNPVFHKSTDSLRAELNNLVLCENINLNGREVTTNNKIKSELEIDVTNGKNIPGEENQMNDLGKQIAAAIKNALENKNEYDAYKVLFIAKKDSSGITLRNWKGKIFKSQEL